MKATNQTGVTLDRISTREELVEVMDLLCTTRLLTKLESQAPVIPLEPAISDGLALESVNEEDTRPGSEDLNSLTNLLVDEFEWLN
jgi:hypothetical protein